MINALIKKKTFFYLYVHLMKTSINNRFILKCYSEFIVFQRVKNLLKRENIDNIYITKYLNTTIESVKTKQTFIFNCKLMLI